MSKSKRRKRSTKQETPLAGKLLLELIGVVAFLMLISATNANRATTATSGQIVEQTAEYGSLVSGYISDQVQRSNLFDR